MSSRAAALIGTALLDLSCAGPSRTPSREARPPNVVLITVDTLRADKLGCYGNAEMETPHIDGLAASGTVFENAATVAPLTLPAHASILTGTYPLQHGIRDNGGYYLEPDSLTIAEVLRQEGYATGAFVAAFVLDSRWGLDQGFDRYYDDFDFASFEDMSLGAVQRRGDAVVEEALRWMDAVKTEPFFSWIHFFDPHAPYEPPEPYRSRHQSRPWGFYDGEVAFVDAMVGRLLEWMDRRKLLDKTIVALVGDHGESLGEHGELEHGFFVYDATMKVPFIVSAPGLELRGRRIPAQVRVIDLMPTILDLLGLGVPSSVQGVSLRPLVSGDKKTLGLVAYGESFYPRNRYGWSELRSLRRESLHFIAAPRPELYDLERDPQEARNLAPERPETIREHYQELEELLEIRTARGMEEKLPEEIDSETRERLAALGYLGASRRPRSRSASGHRLADPKDKIDLHRLMKAAEADVSARRLKSALEKVEQVLAADPEVIEAHRIRGDLYGKMDQPARAAAAYREALTRDPKYKVAAFHLALLDLEAGRFQQAETGLRRVLALDPKDNKTYFLLAKLLISRKELKPALELLDDAIGNTTDVAPFHNLRAECYLALGNLEKASQAVDQALALKPKLPRAHHYRALVQERQGDLSGAVDSYEKEIKIFPHDPGTFLNLAALYRKRGALEKEIQALERARALNPKLAEASIYLARAYLEAGRPEQAQALARKGLAQAEEPALRALGHTVVAEAHRRQRKANRPAQPKR